MTPQMSKPSGVGESEGLGLSSPAADLGELLLNAKLRVLRPRGEFVSRVDLIQRARSSGCRIVGITAPAGYGKSTLLAEWADCEDRRVGAVSFDRFDDDPMALLVLLASAYARIDPEGADLRVEVRGVGASVLGRAAPRLAAAFSACPVPFVLLLDDVHELRSPDCQDVLGLVIAKIPDGSQLVAASRWEQPHLPRLRVSGDALALDARDLALDVDGAQQIFSQAQVSLTPEAATEVTARTEGWPAGLYLAAQIAAEGGSSTLTVSGDHRYVADYLYRESLANQPDDVQRFLRRTAVLDQLGGPLCDAVLATSDSAEQLRRLEASSLFMVPLDRHGEWYRYHALFREFLLAELRRREPDMVDVLHLRAADWYESNGSPAMAVEHLLRTAERHRAAQLATELSQALYNAGRLSTLQRWLVTLGDEAIAAWPPLAVNACLACVLTGDTVGSERWAAMVDAASFDLPPRDGSASFVSAKAMLRALMCPNGPESMLADATLALAEEPPWSLRRPNVLWLLAQAHLALGDVDEARDLFDEASTASIRVGIRNILIASQAELALLALDRGDSDRAGEHVGVARDVIEASGSRTTRRLSCSTLQPPGWRFLAETCRKRGGSSGKRCDGGLRSPMWCRSARCGSGCSSRRRTSPSASRPRPSISSERSTTSCGAGQRSARSWKRRRNCVPGCPQRRRQGWRRRPSPLPSCVCFPTCRRISHSLRSPNVSTFRATRWPPTSTR